MALLLAELDRIIENDRHPLSARIQALREIRALLKPYPGTPAAALVAQGFGAENQFFGANYQALRPPALHLPWHEMENRNPPAAYEPSLSAMKKQGIAPGVARPQKRGGCWAQVYFYVATPGHH